MNTHTEYRRHNYRSAQTLHSPVASEDISQLARHGDPSLTASQPMGTRSRRVAWIRPTELASFTGPLVSRGIDLQTELIRRARRTPITATRAARRRIGKSLQPARTTTSQKEGIGL